MFDTLTEDAASPLEDPMSLNFRGTWGVTALASALTLLGGCGAFGGDPKVGKAPSGRAADSGTTVTVGDDQSGNPVELRADQHLMVKLRYAGTSHTDWTLVGFQPGVLAPVGATRFDQDAAAAQYGEVAGTQSWRFEPTRPGQTTLRFELRVPHSREPASAVATFDVTVR